MRPIAIRLLPPLAAVAILLGLAACAPAPIYKAGASTANVPPSTVASEPERFAGQPVIWGGRVVVINNLPDHSEIEVLAYPLDGSQRPKANDVGSGRFVAQLPGFVEPLDYPAGSLITISGTLSGSRAGNVGEASYVFPLVKVGQSHVWTAEEMRSGHPNISFGLGVGIIR
jgi:outer membrane lipoprotein